MDTDAIEKRALDALERYIKASPGKYVIVNHEAENLEAAKVFLGQSLDYHLSSELFFVAIEDKSDPEGICAFIAMTGNSPSSLSNAEFLAQAHEDVPALATAVLSLAKDLRAAQEIIKQVSRLDLVSTKAITSLLRLHKTGEMTPCPWCGSAISGVHNPGCAGNTWLQEVLKDGR